MIASRICASRIAMVFISLWVFGCGGSGGGSDDSGPVPASNGCGDLGLKIFSGTECTPQIDSPVVPIIIRSTDGRVGLCSGTVVGARSVLTAGHCFRSIAAPISSLEITIGGALVAVRDVVVHPLYREDSDLVAIFADIAVISLVDAVTVRPLAILTSRTPVIGEIISIFGYGTSEQGLPGVLRGGQMRLSDITPTHFFAEFGSEGSNVCLGDSGGPATLPVGTDAVIAGVTSTGSAEAECRRGDVSLFVNLQDPAMRSFLEEQVPDLNAR